MAGNQNGLQDGCSSRFYDMVRIIRYLQTSQRRPLGYIVENVPVVSSSRSRTLESMYKIHGILGVPVLIDAAAVGSRAHRPRLCGPTWHRQSYYNQPLVAPDGRMFM
jgi:hypothetical protein